MDIEYLQLIRYEFLKEWVINATVDEIIEKLIELDNLKKEDKNEYCNSYKNTTTSKCKDKI